MKVKAVWAIVALVISLTFSLFPTSVCAASTVSTSTNAYATNYTFQRKSFYANGRFWVFYCDSGYMRYRTSTDGSSWSSKTIIRACSDGSRFSVWFDGTYLHYAYADFAQIYYRRGLPNSDGSITWSATEQTVSTTYDAAYAPTVSVDSNGYVWIGYRDEYDDGENLWHFPYVIRSGNNDGTWGTTPSGFPYRLSDLSDGLWSVSVIPLTSGKMLVIYGEFTSTVRVRRWDGSSWGSEVTTTSNGLYGFQVSAVAEGDDVHITFLKSSGYDILYTKYVYSTNSLSSEVTIASGADSNSGSALSLANNGTLYCFWTTETTGKPSGATAHHIYYQKSTDGGNTWSSATDWIDESTERIRVHSLTSFYKEYEGKMGLLYTTKTSSPYNVKFEKLVLNNKPTVSLTSPPNGYLAVEDEEVTFSWSFSDDDAGDTQSAYQLQIDDDSDFWSIEYDTGKVSSSDSEVNVTTSFGSGAYYWRVKVWDSGDLASDWSSSRYFTLGYTYIISGAFYENGTLFDANVTVTAYFEDASQDNFEIDGTTTIVAYDERPLLFLFTYQTFVRQWYVRSDSENITVFIPVDSYALYEFSIVDYVGVLDNKTYLEASTYINSTFGTQTVTRVTTATTETITLPLEIGRSYMLTLVGDDITYQFGLFVATEGDTGETLVISQRDAETRIKLVYQYVYADASRPFNDTVVVDYVDSLKGTVQVDLTIKFRNGTVVYTDSEASDRTTFTWNSANENETYIVETTAVHETLGNLTWREILAPVTSGSNPFNINFLGSMPIATTQVFGLALVLLVAGLFSQLSATHGIVITCLFAGFLWAIGWLDVTASTVAICLSLAVLYALGRRRDD